MNEEVKCIKCGETRQAIRKHEMICGGIDQQTGELAEEYGRHRFKPYSEKELKKISEDEKAMCDSMGDFADFVDPPQP